MAAGAPTTMRVRCVMLRNYRAPDGRTYQYEDGTQPDDFVEVKAAPQPKNKARTAAIKARRAKKNA